MIQNFKNIISEKPISEIWKNLRFFLDTQSVSEKIRMIHNISEKKIFPNIKKQAKQIGYCIRQAEEYFHASSQVDLPTRPLLIYYGADSLSRALILLMQDGNHSFDRLRRKNKHNHHGLDLERGLASNIRSSDNVENFLNSLQCKIHLDDKGLPCGNFILFYQSLSPCAFEIPTKISIKNKPGCFTFSRPENCANLITLKDLISKNFNFLTLIKILPDMYFHLTDIKIMPNLCRGDCQRSIIDHYVKNDGGKEKLEKREIKDDYFIHRILSEQKKLLLSYYNPSLTASDISYCFY